MRDTPLRVLLQSKKTVSKKARSKPESPYSSRAHTPNSPAARSQASSRAQSLAGSRQPSEEADASDSEYDDVITLSSTSSISDDQAVNDGYGTPNTWNDRLGFRLSELQDRKRTGVQERESTLWGYLHILRHHFSQDQIANSTPAIMTVLLRSITAGGSDSERLLALNALAVTLLTCPSQTAFDHVFDRLKDLCRDAKDEDIKAGAIHALSIAAISGSGSESAYEEVQEFFLGIIESDGAVVKAEDNGAVVTAALEAWGFVATFVEDLAEQSEQALDAFTEQLDSTDVRVQASAGSNIALVFEAARDHEEQTGESLNLQYNQHKIMVRMSEINRHSSKSMSRRNRRYLKSNFSSIVTSLEQGKGPGYSTAGRGGLNPHTGGQKTEGGDDFREFGYREKIRVQDQVMVINTWSLRARVEALRTHLGGGLAVHLVENPAIDDMLEDAHVEDIVSSVAKKKKNFRGVVRSQILDDSD